MRNPMILSLTVLVLAVTVPARADEPGQVIHRPPAQQQPYYGGQQGGYYGGQQMPYAQVPAGQTIIYQNLNAPRLPPNRFYRPGYGLPIGFQCVQCLVRFLTPVVAEVVAFGPNSMPYLLLPPTPVGPANSYLIAAVNAMKAQGFCPNLPFLPQPPQTLPFPGPGYGPGRPISPPVMPPVYGPGPAPYGGGGGGPFASTPVQAGMPY